MECGWMGLEWGWMRLEWGWMGLEWGWMGLGRAAGWVWSAPGLGLRAAG